MLEGGGYQCWKGLALEDGGAQCWRGWGPNIRGSELPQLWNPWGMTQNKTLQIPDIFLAFKFSSENIKTIQLTFVFPFNKERVIKWIHFHEQQKIN